MSPKEDQIRAVVSQQAADWVVTNQDGMPDEMQRADFVAWLKASPMHVDEYLGMALVTRDLRTVTRDAEGSPEALLEQARADSAGVVAIGVRPATPEPEAKRLRFGSRWALAASAAAVLLAAAVWWALGAGFGSMPTAYRTAHGEQNAWRLADGSIMRLNTDSAVTVRYSRRERLIEVERGQVLFEAAHDERRRFRVAAGEAGAIAVGTRFEVYRKPASTVVTVAEGRVAVFTGEPPRGANADASAPRALQVEAGYQVRIDAGVLSAHAVPVDLHQALAWLQQRIEFENRPLGEIADEYNRYAGVPLEIDDPALRALRVSGAFDTGDPASFVAFVATLDGVRVESSRTRVRVLRSPVSDREAQTSGS